METFGDIIDKACLVINSAIGAGMSWDAIEEMVETEKMAGNPVASIVAGLNLEKNRITVQLENLFRVEGEGQIDDLTIEESACPVPLKGKKGKKSSEAKQTDAAAASADRDKARNDIILVEIHLELSAFANARQMYSNRKVAQTKELKTVEASTKALQV